MAYYQINASRIRKTHVFYLNKFWTNLKKVYNIKPGHADLNLHLLAVNQKKKENIQKKNYFNDCQI
jgi:hypothetical protein